MARNASIWSALVAAGVLLAACSGSSTNQPAPTAAPTEPPASITIARGQPIVIGVSAALSGDQMSLGNDIADAAELALSDYGGSLKGHPLRIERMDDRCTDAEKARNVAHALVRLESIVGIVGPMCTTGAQAADSIYEGAHVVHILPSATRVELSQQGERYFFRTAWRDDVQAKTQAMHARYNLNAENAVLVDDAEPYGKALADAFAAEFEAQGGHIVSRERIDRGTTEFSSLGRQVKNAEPDLVVFEGLNPEGALIVKALHEAGYSGTFVAPDGVLSVRDFIVSGGAASDGAIVTGGPVPSDALVATFRDRFQRAPTTPFVLQSHDAVTALLAAVELAATDNGDGGLVIDRARLADALRAQQFAGLTGAIHFDEDGDRTGDSASALGLTIYRVSNGRFEPVE